MDKSQELGSKTAKDGFQNESDVVDIFNNWENSKIAKKWLEAMNYNISEIEYVKAEKVKGSFKADIQVKISVTIKLKNLVDVQNIQVKLVSNPSGFNQIDKRWVDKYCELWNIPKDIENILKHFTGEQKPFIENLRDKRRMFIDEFPEDQQKLLLDFLNRNKTLIVSDIIKGRGKFAAEWILVILKDQGKISNWTVKPINICMNILGGGEIFITKKGSLKIGNITIQRKGGDNGRETANMLQFKINPCLLIDN